MYFSIAIKLLNTPRVQRILQIDGIVNDGKEKIVLTNKIYSEEEFKLIDNYFNSEYNLLNLPNNPDTVERRREFLKEHLKLPRGLQLADVAGFANHLKPFKKLKNENFITAGVSMERFILDGIERFHLLNKIPQQNNRVYAFQLNNSVLDDPKFLEHNPNIDRNKPAFYIGQTSKTREERHAEHISGIRANKFMKNHGIQTFEIADRTQELAELFKILVDDLRHYQAQYYEFKLTKLLQENGYGAYCN